MEISGFAIEPGRSCPDPGFGPRRGNRHRLFHIGHRRCRYGASARVRKPCGGAHATPEKPRLDQLFEGGGVSDDDRLLGEIDEALSLPRIQLFVDALSCDPNDISEFALRQMQLRPRPSRPARPNRSDSCSKAFAMRASTWRNNKSSTCSLVLRSRSQRMLINIKTDIGVIFKQRHEITPLQYQQFAVCHCHGVAAALPPSSAAISPTISPGCMIFEYDFFPIYRNRTGADAPRSTSIMQLPG